MVLREVMKYSFDVKTIFNIGFRPLKAKKVCEFHWNVSKLVVCESYLMCGNGPAKIVFWENVAWQLTNYI